MKVLQTFALPLGDRAVDTNDVGIVYQRLWQEAAAERGTEMRER